MTSRKRKNWLKYIATAILVVVLAIGGFMVWKSFQEDEEEPVENVSTTPVEQTPAKESESEPETKQEDSKDKTETEAKKKVEQFDGEDPNENTGLTGVITYAGVSGGNLMVRVNIDQYLANGTCKLKLSATSGVVYEETVDVTDSASTATCKGFNIATTKLPSGKININILVTSGEKTGTIEGEVNL